MKCPRSNEIKAIVLGTVLLCAGCGGSTDTTTSVPTSSPAPSATAQPSPLTGFEKDLQFIRNGQYAYVYVFSRKDGKPLDAQDSSFLRTNAPQVVDWVVSEEGKKVIAGTNFNLEEGNMEKLKKRFNTEDYTGR
jgi:hypothetical protein